MNQIGEKIDIKAASCREIYMPDLMTLLKFDLMKFWSWGSHALTVDSTKCTRMFRMTVSGHHHKGHVYIFLSGADLFEVYLTSNQGTIKDKTTEGLYFDMLVDWIDKKIEYIADYKQN
jgi:hypothetical protein